MEDLLQAVTSVRRDLQERKLSRLKQDPSLTYEYRLSLASPKLSQIHHSESVSVQSKPAQRVPAIRIPSKPQDEFTRYLHITPRSASITKCSPIRPRSYKLDAALLLVSRVANFVRKHFRLWKKITDKEKNLETKLFNGRDLVFKVNINANREKNRYKGEKSSDDECREKAQTSRFSPRSPAMNHYSVIDYKTPDIDEVFKVHKNASRKKNTPDKLFPSSTRAGSAISRKSWEKPVKSKTQLLKTFQSTLKNSVQKVQKSIFAILTQKSAHKPPSNTLKKQLELPNPIKNSQKWQKIESGAQILNKLYLNSVSEQFYFMKFRCVVESGFIEESGLLESSQDNLKEYIENIEKSRTMKKEKSFSHKSISYLVSAPSFMNLMSELELKVITRHFLYLKFKILDQFKAINAVVRPFKNVTKDCFEGLKKNNVGMFEGNWKMSSMCHRRINLALNAANKRIKFVMNAGLMQWKHFVFNCGDFLDLKIDTLVEVFEGLERKMKKCFFVACAGLKYRKVEKRMVKGKGLVKGVKALRRYFVKCERSVFYRLVRLSAIDVSEKTGRMPQCVYFLYTQLLHKLRFSFRCWSRRASIKSHLQFLSLKSLCLLQKHFLLTPFLHWKQIS